jgi:membrane-bound lytic murein transglycosylase D
MKYLYSIYKDWSLVLAAYNSGPGNVNKAIRRSGGKTNYWELRPYLPKETGGYVPAFIAANYVMNYAREHNLNPIMPRAIFNEIDTLHIHKRLTFSQLSQVLDMPVEDLEFLNPTYLLGVIPESDHHHVLTLPKSKVPTFINNEQTIYTYRTKETVRDSLMNITRALPVASKTHVARSGESISAIARKYGVTVAELKKWNRLKSNKLKRGQRLKVSAPYKEKVQEVTSQNQAAPEEKKTEATEQPSQEQSEPEKEEAKSETEKSGSKPAANKNYKIYKVRRGDTLWKIAVSHGMTLEEIRKLNGFKSNTKIQVGQKVKVKV